MSSLVPYFREAGAGPGIVCLHANASTSTQWRALMERLSPTHHVLAADLLGAGKSPAWPGAGRAGLDDELTLLGPVFAAAGPRFSLVGHSYGAAVALMAALRLPERVRALVLYEPTLFSLLEAEAPGHLAAQGIRSAAGDAAAAIDAGDKEAAAERFIDYWMGPGSWRQMPPARQAPIAESMVNVGHWANALFCEPTPLQAFGALPQPVLYLTGARSPASSLGVARLLTGALTNVTVIEFPELGHMGPVTHPELVNEAVAAFLARHPTAI